MAKRSKAGLDVPMLAPYEFHGLTFVDVRGKEAFPDECPFCGKSGKFSVNMESGKWRCWSCAEGTAKGGGNAEIFLRSLWKQSMSVGGDYKALAKERRLSPDTLREWGVCPSVITGEWLIPGYNLQGNIDQLYRYARDPGGNSERRRLMVTKGMHHQLMVPNGDRRKAEGVEVLPDQGENVLFCEGPWDAMALWECLRLAGDSSWVIGLPSCNVFPDAWGAKFAGRRVALLFDNDHPRVNPQTKQAIEPAGFAGVRRAAMVLLPHAASVGYLRWGEEGYDPDLPDGHDVRDCLCPERGLSGPQVRVKKLATLLEKIVKVPRDWEEEAKEGSDGLSPVPCDSWAKLTNAWKKAMKWTEGLDRALSVMLASAASTMSVGDQLWIKVIGPPSCGKSTLCEALTVSRKYVKAKSTIRGFHSGYKDSEGGDMSLITEVKGKTLVTKDGDTLLTAPNRDQILAEARDVYDGTSRSHYRHGGGRDHSSVRMTWLLCGTESLRKIDSSELGERFLDCVIMVGIDETLEDAVLRRHVEKAEAEIRTLSNGKANSQHLPEKALAMQLTGGYISHLRENAERLLSSVATTEEAKLQCIELAKFVSYMRARPSSAQEESEDREFSARLLSQLMKLTVFLAVVLNRKTTDGEVMRRVRQVALDTARGKTLEIAAHLHAKGEAGIGPDSLATLINETGDKTRKLLRFLRAIRAVEYVKLKRAKGIAPTPRWRLTARMRSIYVNCVGEEENDAAREVE